MTRRFILAISASFRPSIALRTLLGALLFSAFIYLYHAGVRSPWLYSLLALLSFGFYLKLPRESGFLFGFLVGLLWFYWIALSFRFYDLSYLMPLVWLGIGAIYGVIFGLGLWSENLLYRALFLLILSYIAPFGFDWLTPELALAPSLFGSSKVAFGAILGALWLFFTLPFWWLKPLALTLLPLALYQTPALDPLPFEVEIVETQIPQERRWDRDSTSIIIKDNLARIERAITEKKALILFPETAFPLPLNQNEWLLETLLEKSHQIAIITGALHVEGASVHNSTYFFHQGRLEIAHKAILVPFGERVPLPDSLARLVNDLFFEGALDYEAPEFAPRDFELEGVKLRNAICYEATSAALYANSPRFMVAGSNNAWFHPSHEPTLQHLLLLHYARSFGTTILHATNHSPRALITP